MMTVHSVKTKQEQRRTIAVIRLINFLAAILLLVLLNPPYEGNDDGGIIAIVSGTNGTPDAHMIFSNIVLGFVLKSLYTLIPGIAWYGVVYYLLMAASFASISVLVFRRAENRQAKLCWAALLLCGGCECYTILNFTKAAGVIGLAGVLVLADALGEEKLCRLRVAGAALLIVAAYLVRKEEAFAVAVVAAGVLIPAVGGYVKRHDRQAILKRVRAGVIAALAVLLLIGAAEYADRRAYSSEEWQYYTEYNALRADLLDYGWPDYEQNRALYEALEIDAEDLSLYNAWDFYDTERLTLEDMRTLVQAKEQTPMTLRQYVTNLMQLSSKYLRVTSLFYVLLLIMGIWASGPRLRGKQLLPLLWVLLTGALLFAYLCYIGRALINRVNIGILLAMGTSVVYLMCEEKRELSNGNAAVLLLLSLLLTVMFYGGRIRNCVQENDGRCTEIKSFLAERAQDEEHIYIVDVFSGGFGDPYHVFDTMPAGGRNSLGLGGWNTHLPTQNAVLEKYGIENPYRALVENENARLMDAGRLDLIMTYLRKHYDSTAEAVEESEFHGVKTYRIVCGASDDADRAQDPQLRADEGSGLPLPKEENR